MRDTHVLGVAGLLAFVVIIAVFIGYATDTLPQQKKSVITTSPLITDGPDAKKKDCHCCKERLEKLREHLEKLRRDEENSL